MIGCSPCRQSGGAAPSPQLPPEIYFRCFVNELHFIDKEKKLVFPLEGSRGEAPASYPFWSEAEKWYNLLHHLTNGAAVC